jgi:hypothetical protein
MARARVIKTIEINLHLTLEEARFLLSLTQNAIGSETDDQKKIRGSLFETLKVVVNKYD